jgi:hypothetical protein
MISITFNTIQYSPILQKYFQYFIQTFGEIKKKRNKTSFIIWRTQDEAKLKTPESQLLFFWKRLCHKTQAKHVYSCSPSTIQKLLKGIYIRTINTTVHSTGVGTNITLIFRIFFLKWRLSNWLRVQVVKIKPPLILFLPNFHFRTIKHQRLWRSPLSKLYLVTIFWISTINLTFFKKSYSYVK